MKLFLILVAILTTTLSSFVHGTATLGTSCDPSTDTPTCGSPTHLLSCSQSHWVFQSNCTLGTSCRLNQCVNTADVYQETTTVFTPVACPQGGNVEDCIDYTLWRESFVSVELSRSEAFFTFTLGEDTDTVTNTNGSNGRLVGENKLWTSLVISSVVAAAAIVL
ncbi:hypothetical protein BX661DRAFT_188189 [Kickxella alabastrina]|uniref:uncharacterized protein n=1 Tax=Kickxella alabastrina TaxID=61397 RepID=UPI00221F7BA8|nr:uncharacterized protein BX661DRAFT_188189 [Kickxella alabastrina]KAI7821631.1 hypothetical protein BX661DRAFT_188189 [Kickxella alabastrina]